MTIHHNKQNDNGPYTTTIEPLPCCAIYHGQALRLLAARLSAAAWVLVCGVTQT